MPRKPTAYLGVDPGVSGAMAFLDADGFLLEVIDTPTVTPGKNKRREINVIEVIDILEDYRDEYRIRGVLERVSARPDQGVASTFTFGVSYGVLQAAMAACNVSYELITPQVWKKEFGLVKTEKDASRAVAQRLYPDADLPKGRGVNRADALLLARYAFRKYLVSTRRLFQ